MGSLFAQMRMCRSIICPWTFSSVTNAKFHWSMLWFGQRSVSFRKIGWTAKRFWNWWGCPTTTLGKSSSAPTLAWWKTPIGCDSAKMRPLRTPRADEPEKSWMKIKKAADANWYQLIITIVSVFSGECQPVFHSFRREGSFSTWTHPHSWKSDVTPNDAGLLLWSVGRIPLR